MKRNREWVAALRDELQPVDGPRLSTLRAADVVLWEHMVRRTDACSA